MTPYGLYLKLGAIALILALAVGGGCRWQAHRDAGKLAKEQAAHNTTRAALAITAQTLRQIDADTLLAQQAAVRQAKAARVAGEAARLADERAERLAAEYERRLVIAQRRPKCKDLLDTSVQQLCGL